MKFYERWFCKILSQGRVPNHIAFIMDGNRRFAVKKKLHKTEGHSYGFQALRRVLNICFELKVKELTVYAFAIANFDRSKREVRTLMELFMKVTQEAIDEKDFLMNNQIKLRICGKREMLPKDILNKFEAVSEMTKHNTKMLLNVCLAYTSVAEIEDSARKSI